MKFTGKILTFMIILVMMINAVGVAQVTHICKLAVSGIEDRCEDTGDDSHGCCTDRNENSSAAQSDQCCKDIIKYYHQKVSTTLQPELKLQPLHFFISLLVIPAPADLGEDLRILQNTDFLSVERTGQSIVIGLRTFLI